MKVVGVKILNRYGEVVETIIGNDSGDLTSRACKRLHQLQPHSNMYAMRYGGWKFEFIWEEELDDEATNYTS